MISAGLFLWSLTLCSEGNFVQNVHAWFIMAFHITTLMIATLSLQIKHIGFVLPTGSTNAYFSVHSLLNSRFSKSTFLFLSTGSFEHAIFTFSQQKKRQLPIFALLRTARKRWDCLFTCQAQSTWPADKSGCLEWVSYVAIAMLLQLLWSDIDEAAKRVEASKIYSAESQLRTALKTHLDYD